MWQNFERLLAMRDLFYSKDEIYLDITHGFRYMPILNLFMLETLKALHPKLFEVKAILYGVFAGDESEIVDFKAFLDLLDWIKAINAFKYYGHAYDLASLLEREEKKVSNILKQFSDNFLLGNMQALWGFMKDIEKSFQVSIPAKTKSYISFQLSLSILPNALISSINRIFSMSLPSGFLREKIMHYPISPSMRRSLQNRVSLMAARIVWSMT